SLLLSSSHNPPHETHTLSLHDALPISIHTDPEADVMLHMLGKTHSSSAISGMNRNRGLPLFLKSSQQPVKSPPLLVEMRQIRFISCRKMRITTGQLHLRPSFYTFATVVHLFLSSASQSSHACVPFHVSVQRFLACISVHILRSFFLKTCRCHRVRPRNRCVFRSAPAE